jgi:hypothetical protein
MPSNDDPVVRMLHCLIIVLKIPLFSMPSSHDPVIRMFHLHYFTPSQTRNSRKQNKPLRHPIV